MITDIFNGSDDEDSSTEAQREIARLKAENAALKASAHTLAAPPTPAPSAAAGMATPASTLSRQQLKSARRSAVRSARQSARKDKVTEDMKMLQFLEDRAKANEEALLRSAQESSKITDLAKAVHESRIKTHEDMEEDFDREDAAIELDVDDDDDD